ncbi:hypothetical protein ACILE2_08265 [Capnocytophaga canimorsus]|uniref:hypothetical protein n=1 Tax=Capnocytophaga canimorsus TaxID=28188 RepID=UPI0037D51747
MKVYAHFFKEKGEKEVQYRWRTLLQFGDSWEVIGSVVMKNPGSAKSKLVVSDEKILEQLNKFDASEKWHEFTADNTMQNIEKLFREYSKFNNSDFKGVIQIFNLFNVIEADLGEALKIAQNVKNQLFYQTTDIDLNNLKAPVYLGWGGLGNDEQFKPAALKFFEKVKSLNISYLHNEFEVNSFYHPLYLIGRGKNKPKSIYLKSCFLENTTQPKNMKDFNFQPNINPQNIFNLLKENFKDSTILEENKTTIRIPFPDVSKLQLTITQSGKGSIGVRHTDFNPKENYSKKEYYEQDSFSEILSEFGYTSAVTWLGQKNFKDFDGFSDDEIADEIIAEIESLKTDFDKVK